MINRIGSFLLTVLAHVFVATTAVAAFIHSTWALATMFNGLEPPQMTQAWWGWVIPAALMAFAIDVGQIATSAQIQYGQRTRAKYATFAVLAIATYYLQWLYIAHHLPNLQLSSGINPNVLAFAVGFRDLAVWALPAMFPTATLMYTFSYAKPTRTRTITATQTRTSVRIEEPLAENKSQEQIAPAIAGELQAGAPANLHLAKCEFCNWQKAYPTPRGAINGLNAHMGHNHPASANVEKGGIS